MKRWNSIPIIVLLAAVTLAQSCRSNKEPGTGPTDRFTAVMEYIEQHGDFVNSSAAPGVIGIDAVIQGNPDHKLIIDIRDKEAFDTAHLAGAIHVPMDGLLNLLEHRVNAASFDTIVLVSADAQDAVFATTLLRILGYNNLFALRLGMGWHTNYAEATWNTHVSSGFTSRLSKAAPPQKTVHSYPALLSEHPMAYDLIRERVSWLLSEGYKSFRLQSEEVVDHPEKYYIINYWTEEEYLMGHIPGAFQYTPRKSLGRKQELNTLPHNKPIVVYCHQGNLSSSTAAYLRLIGYEAYSLEFGTNSFMYDYHKELGLKGLFRIEEAIDYPLEGSRSKGMPKNPPPVLVGVRGQGGC